MIRMADQRLQYLFEQQLAGTISDAEKLELAALSLESRHQPQLEQLIDGSWDLTGTDEALDPDAAKHIVNTIVYRGKLRSITWWKIAAAASVVILLGIGSYFAFFTGVAKKGTETAKADIQAPAATRASIILADGTSIPIDSLTQVQQGTTNVVRLSNGEITYKTVGEITKEVTYNTLNNPKGSQVAMLTLSDGSKVWLNAGSSVTYPVAFTGKERKVSMIGEAYFEVAHNAAMPFKVRNRQTEVTVLGTHFNVNAYDDESDIKITLLEGSVKVSSSAASPQSAVLKPGQQANIDIHNSQLTIEHSPDIEQVMAWKNGMFSFRQTDLQSIMRQIARWYDVEVVYDGPLPDRKFGGEIPRMTRLSNVLRVLEESDVKFKMEGRKIIVTKS
jgi:transmembrane sensor